ncbi:LuxR C-terminal-related transcriptional regulator [uncultured Amnibacterium sp.]|uniref:helix-turn-helix transcriptional regulator n=1 Tax=uncultured Amnibacterium sp. TaxID=1631851 RepID=UPI0035CB1D08
MSVLVAPATGDRIDHEVEAEADVEAGARSVLDLVASMHEAADLQDLAARVLTGLGPLVAADSVSWNELDPQTGTGTSTVFVPAAMALPAPRRRFAIPVPPGAAVDVSVWHARLPTLDGDHRLTMTAQIGMGLVAAIGCTRWHGSFGDRQVDLVALLRPHLAPAVDHVRLRSSRRATDASLGTLTTREQEVLALLSDGRTNRQIGAALFINARTVEKHIEHIRAKLGARSRTEAAAIFASVRSAPTFR